MFPFRNWVFNVARVGRSTLKSLSRHTRPNGFWDPRGRRTYPNEYHAYGFLLFGSGIYATRNLDRAPYTGRVRFLDVSRQIELETGKEEFKRIVEENKEKIVQTSDNSA